MMLATLDGRISQIRGGLMEKGGPQNSALVVTVPKLVGCGRDHPVHRTRMQPPHSCVSLRCDPVASRNSLRHLCTPAVHLDLPVWDTWAVCQHILAWRDCRYAGISSITSALGFLLSNKERLFYRIPVA